MRVGNVPDTEYNLIISNVLMHEVNISTKPIPIIFK